MMLAVMGDALLICDDLPVMPAAAGQLLCGAEMIMLPEPPNMVIPIIIRTIEAELQIRSAG